MFFDAGWSVLGLCATEESAARRTAKSYAVQAVDFSLPHPVPEGWQETDALVHCASSRGGGPDAYRRVYRDGLRNLLSAFRPRRVLFVGSTSVYAQKNGTWVNESSPTEPNRETGAILRETEEIALGAGGFVLRLSGLYGPGRSVLLRRFLNGQARIEDSRWLNLIHREDAARAVLHLLTCGALPGIYNGSDDTPATQREIFGWMAKELDRPLPRAGAPDPHRKRGWTNKRVSNRKLRATGWTPQFPGFRDALPALIDAAISRSQQDSTN